MCCFSHHQFIAASFPSTSREPSLVSFGLKPCSFVKVFDPLVPHFPPKVICFLSRMLYSFKSSLQLILLRPYLSKFKNPLYSVSDYPTQDTSDLILSCPLHLVTFQPFFLLQSLVQSRKGCPVFGTSWTSAIPSCRRKIRVTTTFLWKMLERCLAFFMLLYNESNLFLQRSGI